MKGLLGEKTYGDLLGKILILFFIFVLTGVVLLVAAYALPTDRMKKNVARSSALYDYEGVYPQIVNGYKSSQLDNYTDTLMLANAIYPRSSNVIREAMLVKKIEYVNLSMPLSLTSYANDVAGERYETNYPRYWHGYLIILKPLLYFFDVGDIRMINMIGQAIMIFAVIAQIMKRSGGGGRREYAIAFLMTILLLNPVAISLSFQCSWIFYIVLFALLVIWRGPSFLCGTNRFFYYLLIFFVIGMAVSYFDLFTYPLVSLGLPLISILILERRVNWKSQMQLVILACITWGIGYVGMWGSKVIMGSVLTAGSITVDVLSRIVFYATAERNENIPITESIYRSLKVLLRWPYVLGFGGTFVYFIVEAYRRNRRFVWKGRAALPYVPIMCLPLLHMLVVKHVYFHYWFTYRELSITVFAGYSILLLCFAGKKEKGINENRSQNG